MIASVGKHSLKTLIFFLCLILFGCGQLSAQDSIHVDLDKALEIALSESPTMRIADRTVDIKREYKRE